MQIISTSKQYRNFFIVYTVFIDQLPVIQSIIGYPHNLINFARVDISQPSKISCHFPHAYQPYIHYTCNEYITLKTSAVQDSIVTIHMINNFIRVDTFRRLSREILHFPRTYITRATNI